MTEAQALQVLKTAALRWARYLEEEDRQRAMTRQTKIHVLEIEEIDNAIDETPDPVPEGWVVNAIFPADRYFVRREDNEFVMYCEDDHGAFS